ncbi:MAG: hypothetical protein SGJ17_13765, partial [Hyphomicrobiales bacterium]|nr:hypothetical protein [Hyphomicrobiales bacterium]
MTRQNLNELFARTSFLHGANSSYVEALYGKFQENPGAVSADWRAFFTDLKERKEDVLAEVQGPSWKRKDWPPSADGDLVRALTGDFSEVEREIEKK